MGTCGQYNMKFFKCSAAFEMHFKSTPMSQFYINVYRCECKKQIDYIWWGCFVKRQSIEWRGLGHPRHIHWPDSTSGMIAMFEMFSINILSCSSRHIHTIVRTFTERWWKLQALHTRRSLQSIKCWEELNIILYFGPMVQASTHPPSSHHGMMMNGNSKQID